MKKKNFTIFEIKKFLKKKDFLLLEKKILKFKKESYNSTRSFYYTFITSLVVIGLFFSIPTIVIFKNQIFYKSEEVKNNSKINLEKVLNGESIGNEQEEEIDSALVFEDIFEYENIPTDTVRLNASTVKQLFKDTKYNLKEVRKNKLVKPIKILLLPDDIKKIESSEEKKELFIQIVLPFILEENNEIISSRQKLFSILNKSNNTEAEKKWLNMKFKQYGVKKNDVFTLKTRMDIIPASLAIAQAAKETGWGTSRFAVEGNALFGQWTYSGDGLKPLAADSNKTHKVMKFSIIKASIKAYQRNLNTHSSYIKFRKARAIMRDNDENLNSIALANYLDEYAETGKEYTKILIKIIKQNELTDFDDVKLLPTSIKLKSLI